jgi:hypothetical protein
VLRRTRCRRSPQACEPTGVVPCECYLPVAPTSDPAASWWRTADGEVMEMRRSGLRRRRRPGLPPAPRPADRGCRPRALASSLVLVTHRCGASLRQLARSLRPRSQDRHRHRWLFSSTTGLTAPRRLVSNDHTHLAGFYCCRRAWSRPRCVSPFGLGGGQGPLGIPQPAAKAGRSGDRAPDGGSDRLGCPDQDQASAGSGHCRVEELSGENW